MSLRTDSLRCVAIGAALAASDTLAAIALGQPQGQNVSQEGTSRAGSRNNEEPAQSTSIDAQTGKIINEAIELMNVDDYAAALASWLGRSFHSPLLDLVLGLTVATQSSARSAFTHSSIQ